MNSCRLPYRISEKRPVQPQPPKLPKPQTTKDTNQAKNLGPLVPFSPTPTKALPVSPSVVTNRYLVSTIPKPNYERPQGQHSYSSALATPPPKALTPYTVEEPFGPIVPKKLPSLPPRIGRSSYIKKPFVQHISYIEPHLVHLTDPLALAMEVLPTGWHFLPKSPKKKIKFYKGILT